MLMMGIELGLGPMRELVLESTIDKRNPRGFVGMSSASAHGGSGSLSLASFCRAIA